ncbi:MAG: hypothetical protein M1816_007502 [Peltula sp. TS41687]|nr:MAG: hypothetical protein M1816_007502 [Peltula sp. TS41687]
MRAHDFVSAMILILLTVLFAIGETAQIPRQFPDVAGIETNPVNGSELARIILASIPRDRNESFLTAVQLISSLKSSPTCTHLATRGLLSSCREVESGHDSNDQPSSALDQVRSVYAARLAVCELLEAGTTVPPQCASMIPSQVATRDRFLPSYFTRTESPSEVTKGQLEDVDIKTLHRCLNGLHSRSQWWTSYSNARQNAVVICQAIRSDIDRDELLGVHERLVEVTSKLGMSLSEAFDRSSSYLAREAKFADAVRNLQREAQEDLHRGYKDSQSTFEKLFQDFQTGVQQMSANISTTGKDLETKLVDLNQTIQHSAMEVEDMRHSFGHTLQEIEQGSSELALKQRTHWRTNQELVDRMMSTLQFRINNVIVAVSDVEKQLVLNVSQARSNAINKQTISLSTELTVMKAQFEDFRDVQQRERELVTQFHQTLHTDMDTILAFMQEVSHSALNLQSVVNDTSAKLEAMGIPALISVLNKYLVWTFWFSLMLLFLVMAGFDVYRRYMLLGVFVSMFYHLGIHRLIGSIYLAISHHTSVLSVILGPSFISGTPYPAIGGTADGGNGRYWLFWVLQTMPIIIIGVGALKLAFQEFRINRILRRVRREAHHRDEVNQENIPLVHLSRSAPGSNGDAI